MVFQHSNSTMIFCDFTVPDCLGYDKSHLHHTGMTGKRYCEFWPCRIAKIYPMPVLYSFPVFIKVVSVPAEVTFFIFSPKIHLKVPLLAVVMATSFYTRVGALECNWRGGAIWISTTCLGKKLAFQYPASELNVRKTIGKTIAYCSWRNRTNLFRNFSINFCDRFRNLSWKIKPWKVRSRIGLHGSAPQILQEIIWTLVAFIRFLLSACDSPLGMEDSRIKDDQISALTWLYFDKSYTRYYRPHFARLNYKKGGGGWCSEEHERYPGQYLEIDLGVDRKITSIGTQGRHGGNEWVDEYGIIYKRDNDTQFRQYSENGRWKVDTET